MLLTAALISHALPSLLQTAEELTIKFRTTIKPLVPAPATDHQLTEVKAMEAPHLTTTLTTHQLEETEERVLIILQVPACIGACEQRSVIGLQYSLKRLSLQSKQ